MLFDFPKQNSIKLLFKLHALGILIKKGSIHIVSGRGIDFDNDFGV